MGEGFGGAFAGCGFDGDFSCQRRVFLGDFNVFKFAHGCVVQVVYAGDGGDGGRGTVVDLGAVFVGIVGCVMFFE